MPPPITYYINPTGSGNLVGLGILLGWIIHTIINRNTFFSMEKTDLFSLILLIVHFSGFILILGSYLYQLGFYLFRYYNQKLMPIRYQPWVEGIIQVFLHMND